ncbi:MAG TPA: hypothetical protein VMZ53_23770 [Kofleriaceae bacterium]|nr:hypothetical protein [Kofleriaceae bacterium]
MGELSRWLLVVPALLVAGCLNSASVDCGDGRVCPSGTMCHPLGCVAPSQLETCHGIADRVACTLPGSMRGVCKSEVCIAEGCGDGFALGGEECDGVDFAFADCKALGYHDATPLETCRGDCTFDRSVCGSRCGDGVLDPAFEDCDASALEQVADCKSLDYYNAGTVTCTSFCTFDSTQCTGFCGDGVVNGGEFCDGSASDAGCAAFGYDAGRIGCASGACAPLFGSCVQLGWQPIVTEPDVYVTAFWGAASDDIWAVGGDLAILHFNGQGWTKVSDVFGGDSYNSIWGTAANDVWVVGGGIGSKLAHLQNGVFVAVTSPTTQPLFGVWGSSPANYWAVGGAGTILHYDGQSWTVAPTLTNRALRAVWGNGPDNVWAVGDGGVVLHRTSSGWSVHTASMTNISSLNGVWGDSTGTVWLAGQTGDNYSVLLRGPSSWSDMGVRFFGALTSVWGSGPKDVWFVGGDNEDIDTAQIFHYDGARITEHETPAGLNSLSYVWGTGPNDVWSYAIGEQFTHNEGTGWRRPQTGDVAPAFFHPWDIYGASPTSIWIVGDNFDDGITVRYNGTNLVAVTPTFPDLLYAVTGSGPNDVWAVGQSGIVVHSTNGSSWTEITPRPFSTDLFAAWSPGPNKLIACGNGVVIEFDGQDWSGHSIDGSCSGIWGSAPNDVWAVGSHIWHYDGTTWTQLPSSPAPDGLFEIWGSGKNDVWAAGRNGAVVHYDGATWTSIDTVAVGLLTTLWGTAPNDIWMAGQLGAVTTVYHYDGIGWLEVDVAASSDWISAIGGTARTILFGGRNANNASFVRVLDRTSPWSCSTMESACNDAVDNDCDGKIDDEDVDCP